MPAPSPCPRARCARHPGPALARTFGLPSGARPAGGDVAGVAGWRRLPRSPRPFSVPPALPTLGAPHSAALSEPRVNTGPFIRLSEITLDVCPV